MVVQPFAVNAYYDRKRTQGESHNQAVRALGRQMTNVIWAMLRDERDYELQKDVHPMT